MDGLKDKEWVVQMWGRLTIAGGWGTTGSGGHS